MSKPMAVVSPAVPDIHPLPPGPRTPAAWQLLHYTLSPMGFLDQCQRRYGDTFTVRLAGYGTFVMLASPEAVRDVFRGDPHVLHSGEGNEFMSVTVGPNSVLVLDEELHARQRRVLFPPLKGTRMRSYFAAMQTATLETIRVWPRNQPIRMDVSMQQITLRVIAQAVLGFAPGPELTEFERLVQAMLATTRSRLALVYFKTMPLKLFQKIPGFPYFRQLRELDRAFYALIERRRRIGPESRGDNVLADLLTATHDDGSPLTDGEIRDALITLLIAGFETTALALAWTIERIVAHPHVVDRIKDELDRVTGGSLPGPEQLAQMDYLDAAIREGLRTRMIVPFVVRKTKAPFEAAGRWYPPGVLLCPCNYLVHLRPDLYPEPHEFRPERFLERTYAAHEWFPFGGGNRMCLGMALALYEMKAVLSTLFSQVRLSRPPGAKTKPIRRGIVMTPSDGVKMVISEPETSATEKINLRR
jgi:cytochrome P450